MPPITRRKLTKIIIIRITRSGTLDVGMDGEEEKSVDDDDDDDEGDGVNI
ncbi:MAG: hypothetical protein ACTSRK_00265 [Promethearchaeota archaeon]